MGKKKLNFNSSSKEESVESITIGITFGALEFKQFSLKMSEKAKNFLSSITELFGIDWLETKTTLFMSNSTKSE